VTKTKCHNNQKRRHISPLTWIDTKNHKTMCKEKTHKDDWLLKNGKTLNISS